MEKILEVQSLNKVYDTKTVLNNLNFDVYKGEFLSLLGPSGCGKTTLLKLLIGIEHQDSGVILKYGEDITNKTPYQRNIGIVFQNYALFPNMTVYENIAYALRCKKMPKEEIKAKVDEIISIFELDEHVNKKPRHLSGGQQQRVAMARTLVLNPDIILFDEPMSALDADIKIVLRKLLKRIQKKFDITMIYVTHDQEEAFALSDRIMLIDEAEIVQIDKPNVLYNYPKNDFVKRFIVDHLDNKILSIKERIQND